VPAHWRPVGPLPAATYWTRRALVALVALALVAAIVWLLGTGGDDDTLRTGAAPTQEPRPGSPDPAADPTADPTAGPSAPPPVCPDEVLQVEVTTDAAGYAVGAPAELTLAVRNAGPTPCRRAVGPGAVELVFTPGRDRVWSSRDCAPGLDEGEGAAEGEVALEPGGSQTVRATWPGTRSAPSCPPDQPQARPGTYRVQARVGELGAPAAVFRVGG
jgi:hypothetical protein